MKASIAKAVRENSRYTLHALKINDCHEYRLRLDFASFRGFGLKLDSN